MPSITSILLSFLYSFPHTVATPVSPPVEAPAITTTTPAATCSPDYYDPTTLTTIRLCPERTIHVLSASSTPLLVGSFDAEASTDNTHFFRRGAPCPGSGGTTYSSELVFTCCAPHHTTKENHINSAMQVAPCFFLLEACASRACGGTLLEEVEVLTQTSNGKRLPPSMLHIDVKDILKQMMDGSVGGSGGRGGSEGSEGVGGSPGRRPRRGRARG